MRIRGFGGLLWTCLRLLAAICGIIRLGLVICGVSCGLRGGCVIRRTVISSLCGHFDSWLTYVR